jgi:hypothetical protein
VKSLSIYLLLLVYAAAQLKPLTAVINDVLAHTFWKVEHMATIHYENGHYHLHNELKTIAEDDKNSTQEKVPSSEKSNETNSNQLVHELNFDLLIPMIYVSPIIDPKQNIVSGFSQINSPPPKQV